MRLGPVPPTMPNPSDTPNCRPGKMVTDVQVPTAIGALEIQAAIAAATTGVAAILFPFGISGGWERIVHAKDVDNNFLGEGH